VRITCIVLVTWFMMLLILPFTCAIPHDSVFMDIRVGRNGFIKMWSNVCVSIGSIEGLIVKFKYLILGYGDFIIQLYTENSTSYKPIVILRDSKSSTSNIVVDFGGKREFHRVEGDDRIVLIKLISKHLEVVINGIYLSNSSLNVGNLKCVRLAIIAKPMPLSNGLLIRLYELNILSSSVYTLSNITWSYINVGDTEVVIRKGNGGERPSIPLHIPIIAAVSGVLIYLLVIRGMLRR